MQTMNHLLAQEAFSVNELVFFPFVASVRFKIRSQVYVVIYPVLSGSAMISRFLGVMSPGISWVVTR